MSRLAEIAVSDDLVARARRGDGGAQSQLYGLLAPGAFGVIRRLVGSRAQAEDVFQDTMILFFERLEEFRGEAPIGAWLRRIAITRCLMHLRSPWQRARLQLDRLTRQRSDASSEPRHEPESTVLTFALLSQPAADAEAFDIERALASLAPTARAVVWLYEVEGFTHEEIARSFGRSISFSKSQLARAHARLRAWFEIEPDARADSTRKSCTPV